MNLRSVIVAFTGLCLLGQGPAPTGSPAAVQQVQKIDPVARLEITPKGRVKIPSVGPREKYVQAYTFKNVSGTPISLRVMDLAPGVSVEGPALQQPIAAAESATLKMTIDTTDWVGWQRRNVRLKTDDPHQGEYYLPVEMTVRPDLTVDAERKGFGVVASHEIPQLSFLFRRETGDPTQLRLVSELPEYLKCEMEIVKNTTEVRLTLHPDKVAPGVAFGLETLQIETNAPQQPKFTLYVDWTLRRVVEATPTRVVFLDPLKPASILQLKRHDNKRFAIEKMDVEGEGFLVTAVTKGSASKHRLRILRKATQDAKAMLSLRFKGEEEVLKVPMAYLPGK